MERPYPARIPGKKASFLAEQTLRVLIKQYFPYKTSKNTGNSSSKTVHQGFPRQRPLPEMAIH